MSSALILEGGGMRGLYTAGVLDGMLEEKVKVDGMVTVSAGALFGINFPSKQKGRTLRYNKRYINDDRYISFKSLIKTGNIVNTDFAYHTVPFSLDKFDEEAFEESDIDFYATITNVETGQPEYVLIENGVEQIDVLEATGAMPFVSKIVEIDGNKYLDGGVSDSIPVEKAKDLGYEKQVVVLTRPSQYRKKKPSSALIDLVYRKYPKFADQLKKRHLNYNETIEKIIDLEKEGKIFIIRPTDYIPIKRLERDSEKLQEMYDLGFSDVKEKMSQLKAYLEE